MNSQAGGFSPVLWNYGLGGCLTEERMNMANKERMFFEAGTDDLGVQAVAFSGGKDVSFSCNNEWCGDTESGFGATVSVSLGRADAEKLRDFLDAWLKTPNA